MALNEIAMITRPVDPRHRLALGDRSQLARLVVVALALATVCVFCASILTGAADASLSGVIRHLVSGGGIEDGLTARDRIIILDIRLPRAITGLLVGAALAVSGAVMQGLFRNPLADPGLVGVSAGASLGAVTAIMLGGSLFGGLSALAGMLLLPVAAFGGGLATTLLLYRLATRSGQTSVATMLLAGLALSALAGAATGIFIFLANDAQLRDLTFWSLGSLAGASWLKVSAASVIILLSLAVLPFLARGLNAMTLGEATAFHIGVPVQRLKTAAILSVAAATGAAVAVSGGIGFVGIIVPHMLRLAIGPDHRALLPACALLGGTLLMLADMVARTIVAPTELPIGIITAIAGAPVFLWILLGNRRGAGL